MMPIPLDRTGDVSLQEQIYNYIRDRVTEGTLPAGRRLPATRILAQDLLVSRNTAVLAYDRLLAEGYVEARSAHGTFVAEITGTVRMRKDDPVAPQAAAAGAPDEARQLVEPPMRTAGDVRPVFDFWYGRTDPRLFPAQIWRTIGADVLGACATGLSEYGTICGDPDLRQAIADHLATTRGINARRDQIIITTGAQEALNLIGRLFLGPDSAVAVETPGYAAAAQVFEAYGGRLFSCPLDQDGLDPALLRGIRPKLTFVTPSHQFPTGVVMGLERRQALIRHCAQHGGLIVEDDYDSDIVFEHAPIAALAAIDGLQRTVYVGSFSKSLGSGLRLGYVVMPARFMPAAQAAKSLMSYGQSWLDQQILARFMTSGRYLRHLRRLRVCYRDRRDAAIAGLRTTFGDDCRIAGAETGVHLCCALPLDGPDADAVSTAARPLGVGLYSLSVCGVRTGGADTSRSLVVGYAGLAPKEIGQAFARLRAAMPAVG
jgi:GntR family transcriptional regulator/MocR family aminotransferase